VGMLLHITISTAMFLTLRGKFDDIVILLHNSCGDVSASSCT
jgi:hypothetical protein